MTRPMAGSSPYLDQPAQYRDFDPDLFDWLKCVVEEEGDRRTARIEDSRLLGTALFQSTILTDRRSQRAEYFSDCEIKFSAL